VLDIDNPASSGSSDYQSRLHAEIGRDLQHIDYLGGRRRLVGRVDVREDREPEVALDALEDGQALFQAGSMVVAHVAPVVLAERGFENDRKVQALGRFGQRLGRPQHRGVVFDHARARDEEQVVTATGDFTYRYDLLSHRLSGFGPTYGR
jgi:hypothetical protein